MVKALALALLLAAPLAAQGTPQTTPGPQLPKSAVSGRFVFPARPVWAGQVFDLKLVWRVDWDLFRALTDDPVWKPDPLIADAWTRDPPGKPAPEGGKTIALLTSSTQAMAIKPGPVKLRPVRQDMQFVTGGYETDGVKIVTIGPGFAESIGATLQVRPLPPAPSGFTGAVGDFALTSSLDKVEAEAGKPVVWTLKLSGTGNWTAFGGMPSRALPRAFDLVGAPKAGEAEGGDLFRRTITEAITIIPRKAGTYTLGPVTLPVFDPVAGRYVTVTAPAITLGVKPGPAGSEPPNYEAEPDPIPAGEPLPPPLAGTGAARSPMATGVWRAMLALPIAALALLWLTLAWARARAADPERLARRAHRRLARTLTALARAPDEAERRRLVRAWQRDAAVRMKIGHAAPAAGAFQEAEWTRLWDEAELHLYGRSVPLPADWPARAVTALQASGTPPRFDPRTVLSPRNLYPVAALLCVLASPALLRAADPVSLQQRLDAHPGDWIARYDLARAAAETKRWPAAATLAGIAWVQQPRSAETAALWTRSAREAGFGGSKAGGLPLPEEPRTQLTGLLAPAEWQAATLALLWIACGGAAARLLRRFGHMRHSARAPALAAIALGLTGTIVGFVGLGGYGPAGAADAAIVWRRVALRDLPVDTPEDEAASALAPGTVGHMDARFLGWTRFTLASGRSGWLRHDDLLPLWRARS